MGKKATRLYREIVQDQNMNEKTRWMFTMSMGSTSATFCGRGVK